MFYNVNTYFISPESDLSVAYETYVDRVGRAADHSSVDVLFISPAPIETSSEEAKEHLIEQFRIERPNDEWRGLKLYVCNAVINVHDNADLDSVGELFIMDEEHAVADLFPSGVTFTMLNSWAAEGDESR